MSSSTREASEKSRSSAAIGSTWPPELSGPDRLTGIPSAVGTDRAPRRALITGIGGQDGSYLAEFLLENGYEVHGLTHGSGTPELLDRLGLAPRVGLHAGDLLDQDSLLAAVRASEPDEVYNLAAFSSVGESWLAPVATAGSTAVGATRLLEAVREASPRARYFQASSSEMFGVPRERPQRELTPFDPISPYGAAKLYAHNITVDYRRSHGLHASCGILFAHDSPRRGEQFVTHQITSGAAALKLGRSDELVLGRTDVKRDWGFAGDYVEAIWMMLQRDEPDDYVLGTGVSHSVQDVVDRAFARVGLDPDGLVRTDPARSRPSDIGEQIADPAKAKHELGWSARVGFDELIEMMVDAALRRLGA